MMACTDPPYGDGETEFDDPYDFDPDDWRSGSVVHSLTVLVLLVFIVTCFWGAAE
jgi:hypothetical protein